MRTHKLNGAYSFEYALNKNIDVQVIVTDYNEVTITHYIDNDQFDIIPSAKEKEKWLQKVEDIKVKRLKVYSYLDELDELLDKINLAKEEILSILDPEEDNDIIAAIENGNTIEEIENILDR